MVFVAADDDDDDSVAGWHGDASGDASGDRPICSKAKKSHR